MFGNAGLAAMIGDRSRATSIQTAARNVSTNAAAAARRGGAHDESHASPPTGSRRVAQSAPMPEPPDLPDPPPPLTPDQRARLLQLIHDYQAEHDGTLPPPEWTDEQLRRIREEDAQGD